MTNGTTTTSPSSTGFTTIMAEDSNCTISVENFKAILQEWNFALGIILLAFIIILQYAYATRNLGLYVIKLVFLWLLWPVTLTCFVIAAVYYMNYVYLGFSVFFASAIAIMWLGYWIASIRLFRRTGSAWSFSPEANRLLNVAIRGTMYTRPVPEDASIIVATVYRSHLIVAGHKLGRTDLSSLSTEVTVATARTLSYYKLSWRKEAGAGNGVALYARYKVGNHRVPNSRSSDDNDDVLLLVS
uniref:Membrane protein n=1 Tax=Zaria bat coronavirus TaxID=989337 RepID=F1BYM2_9BETC|nr:putative membrane protein [Zaria bat coronavirus]